MRSSGESLAGQTDCPEYISAGGLSGRLIGTKSVEQERQPDAEGGPVERRVVARREGRVVGVRRMLVQLAPRRVELIDLNDVRVEQVGDQASLIQEHREPATVALGRPDLLQVLG